MPEVIVNTTPIIALAGIGHLDLLQKLYSRVMIPEAVDREIISEPTRTLFSSAEWIDVERIKNPYPKSAFSSRLHAGEIEVIVLAQETEAELLIIDDNAAKNTAKYLGMKVTGTMGVLLRAKKEGFIKEVRPLLDNLEADGFYISRDVRRFTLEQAKEE